MARRGVRRRAALDPPARIGGQRHASAIARGEILVVVSVSPLGHECSAASGLPSRWRVFQIYVVSGFSRTVTVPLKPDTTHKTKIALAPESMRHPVHQVIDPELVGFVGVVHGLSPRPDHSQNWETSVL
jgi:hypothetical protein